MGEKYSSVYRPVIVIKLIHTDQHGQIYGAGKTLHLPWETVVAYWINANYICNGTAYVFRDAEIYEQDHIELLSLLHRKYTLLGF